MGEDLSQGQSDLTPQQPGLGGGEISNSEEDSQSEEEKDRALRARHSQPPLTEDDIARLTASRGRRPTEDEIDGMNRAREQGIHTSIV